MSGCEQSIEVEESGKAVIIKHRGDDTGLSNSPDFHHLLHDLYFRLEERDKWANHSIQYLLVGNGGGLTLLLAYISQEPRIDQPTHLALLIALALFGAGILSLGYAVAYAGFKARSGRRRVRTLMQTYLDHKITYKTAFFHLGELPSKWRYFSLSVSLSFILFVAGVVAASTYLAIFS